MPRIRRSDDRWTILLIGLYCWTEIINSSIHSLCYTIKTIKTYHCVLVGEVGYTYSTMITFGMIVNVIIISSAIAFGWSRYSYSMCMCLVSYDFHSVYTPISPTRPVRKFTVVSNYRCSRAWRGRRFRSVADRSSRRPRILFPWDNCEEDDSEVSTANQRQVDVSSGSAPSEMALALYHTRSCHYFVQ